MYTNCHYFPFLSPLNIVIPSFPPGMHCAMALIRHYHSKWYVREQSNLYYPRLEWRRIKPHPEPAIHRQSHHQVQQEHPGAYVLWWTDRTANVGDTLLPRPYPGPVWGSCIPARPNHQYCSHPCEYFFLSTRTIGYMVFFIYVYILHVYSAGWWVDLSLVCPVMFYSAWNKH